MKKIIFTQLKYKINNLKTLIMLFLLLPTCLLAAPVNKTFIGDKAIQGYDPVAYFTQKKPLRGEEKYSYKWRGANWYFVSKANRNLFKKNPTKYSPQYGGYCAYAVSKGYTADIDPQAWDIYKDKLYLNYDKDVQKEWRKDRNGYIKKANKNWPKLKK